MGNWVRKRVSIVGYTRFLCLSTPPVRWVRCVICLFLQFELIIGNEPENTLMPLRQEHERIHYLVIGPRTIVDSVNEGLTSPY